MSAPTLRELVALAIPAPCDACDKVRARWDAKERRMASSGNFGVVPLPDRCEKHAKDIPPDKAAEYIRDRLSPEVALAIYDNAEFIRDHNDGDEASYRAAINILRLLDGLETPNPERK